MWKQDESYDDEHEYTLQYLLDQIPQFSISTQIYKNKVWEPRKSPSKDIDLHSVSLQEEEELEFISNCSSDEIEMIRQACFEENQANQRGKNLVSFKEEKIKTNRIELNLVDHDEDQRQEVTPDQLKSLPYSAIGYLTMRYKETPDSYYGTAFLIGQNIALTCAHNCYHKNFKQEAEQINIHLGLVKGKGTSYKVKKWIYPNQFQQKYQKRHDYAILFLENSVSEYGYLKMIVDQPINDIRIVGFPAEFRDQVLRDTKKMVCASGKATLVQDGQLLEYDIPTSAGQSGAPILVNSQGKFYAVGIHLGETEQKNFGIVLNQTLSLQYQIWTVSTVLELDYFKLGAMKGETFQKQAFHKLQTLSLRYSLRGASNSNLAKLFQAISHMQQLIDLDLGENEMAGIKEGSALPSSLVILKLDGNYFEDQFVASLNSRIRPNLKTLLLGSNKLKQPHLTMQSFPVLERLDLKDCSLTSETLKNLGRQKFLRLSELNLDNNALFEKGTANLQGCQFPALQVLILNSTGITVEALQKLDKIKMPLLKHLQLASNKMGEDMFNELGKLKLLDRICILNISENLLTSSLKALGNLKLPHIVSLYLSMDYTVKDNQKLRDEHLNLLRKTDYFKKLRCLSMNGCLITHDALKQLLRQSPEMKYLEMTENERVCRLDPNEFPDKKIFIDE